MAVVRAVARTPKKTTIVLELTPAQRDALWGFIVQGMTDQEEDESVHRNTLRAGERAVQQYSSQAYPNGYMARSR